MQSEVGAVRAPVSGGERFKKSVWFGKTMKNVSGNWVLFLKESFNPLKDSLPYYL
jgi:hypothetical protein